MGRECGEMCGRFGWGGRGGEGAPKLLPREDDDIAAEIRAVLRREGIRLRTDAECMELKKKGKNIVVGLHCKGGKPIAEGSHVLLAVGRTPNTADLGRRQAGIETDERGYIRVDDECRPSRNGVLAPRECNVRGSF